ncbi:DUF2231 domain-containing protein [Arthrobacter roseus]|uniref:DUF2231 domain-containing protein n=1 Tax=Arthrobacter roseus TaxID=136274 RepID=UPI001962CD19|nr:DUF2231 domain-containing protein [Arthrobacter roseus]MBM7848575.1 nitrite reductase/ring-hydroxylating ferredoxin subunit/uncharacterized membrane protein [Arthrobacter roseus]
MVNIRPSDLVVRLEKLQSLDPIVNRVREVVQKVLQPQHVRDLLHGVPLGHPLHPLMVQVPLGSWISAAILDVIPGTERAARTLIGVGVLSAAPAAASGYADWSETDPSQQRVGIVHSTANLMAVLLYAASWQQRAAQRSVAGKALSYSGLVVVLAGGFLGGHLSFRQKVGMDHSDDLTSFEGKGWQDLGLLTDFPENQLSQRALEGSSLAVYRRGQKIYVLSDVCSHLAGPLHEGSVADVGGSPCVVCPWHQSTFALDSGGVIRGPATAPQAALKTRIVDGVVQVAAQSES